MKCAGMHMFDIIQKSMYNDDRAAFAAPLHRSDYPV